MKKLQITFKTKLQGLVLHVFTQEKGKTIESPVLISKNDHGLQVDLNLLKLGQNCLLVVQNDGTQNGIVQCGIGTDKEHYCEVTFDLSPEIKYYEVCSFFIKNDSLHTKPNLVPMVLATNDQYTGEIRSAYTTSVAL